MDHRIVTSKYIVIRGPRFDDVSGDRAEVMNVGGIVPQLVIENLVVRRINDAEWVARTGATGRQLIS